MKGAVAQILPWIDRAGDIDIQDPEAPGGALRFRTRNGNVPLDGLSLGHRSVMAWIVDLAWRLVKRYPDSTNPLQEPAVVLIDQVDLHVHPVWQRRIMADLSRQFTNVQFVATTQSPLLITSMKGVNVAVLGQSKQDGHIIIENDREVDEGWRFDHVLVECVRTEEREIAASRESPKGTRRTAREGLHDAPGERTPGLHRRRTGDGASGRAPGGPSVRANRYARGSRQRNRHRQRK